MLEVSYTTKLTNVSARALDHTPPQAELIISTELQILP